MQLVDEDERNEQAWLLLSALVNTPEEQQICLENVLAINPDNARAKKGLDIVNQKLASEGISPSPASSEPAGTEFTSAPDNSAGSGFDFGAQPQQPQSDNPFGNWDSDSDDSEGADASPFGDWGSSLSEDQSAPTSAFDNWGASAESEPSAPATDPFSSASSVDWGRDATGPTAYGSGKQVDLPSETEYDDWVQGLNLDGMPGQQTQQAPGGSSPFVGDEGASPFDSDSDPFGSTPDSFSGNADVFGPSGSGAGADSWDAASVSPVDDSGAGSTGSASSPFGTSSPFDDTNPFESSAPAFDPSSPFGEASSPFDETSSPFDETSSPFDETSSPFEDASSPFGDDDLRNAALDSDDSSVFGGGVFEAGDSPDSAESPFDAGFDAPPSSGSGSVAEIVEVDEDDEFGDLDAIWEDEVGEAASGPPAFALGSEEAAVAAQDYFSYIPGDIQPKSTGSSRPMVLVGIVVLALLNLASAALLIVQLTG
jgi:hypothetical protein